MRLFSDPEARHFCAPLAAHVPGLGQSLVAFHDGLSRSTTHLSEGTDNFAVHRVSLLNAVERWLLFGMAHYRRSLDMLIPSTAPWAQVTLYYSSFYAANAILGMFGAWVNRSRLVDVERGDPSAQLLRIQRRITRSPTGYQGSHYVFWDFFYEGCNTIAPWVPPQFESVTKPVSNNRAWQAEERNRVNYDMFFALEAAIRLKTTFNPRKLRASLTGPLAQQFAVTEDMLKLAIHFAKDFGLVSFGLDGFAITGTRSRVMRTLVTQATPGLVTQSALQDLLS